MKETKKQTFQNSFVALLLLFRGKTIGYSETEVHSAIHIIIWMIITKIKY
jgi:hypothetical protein